MVRIWAVILLMAFAPVGALAEDGDGCDGNTMEMVECLGEKIDAADVELNRAYQDLIAAVRQQKEEMNGEAGSAEVEEHVRKAQRAWNDWREKECVAESEFQFTGGTGRGPAHQACTLRLITERTAYLRALTGKP